MAGSAHGKAAREHLKGLVTAFGPRLSRVTDCWIQILGLASTAQHHEPSTALWSCQCLEFHGDSMAGKSAGLCQRGLLRFPFLPPYRVVALGCWGGLRFQPASASEMLSTPKALSQLFEERICVDRTGHWVPLMGWFVLEDRDEQ